jgi:hypothetical protein
VNSLLQRLLPDNTQHSQQTLSLNGNDGTRLSPLELQPQIMYKLLQYSNIKQRTTQMHEGKPASMPLLKSYVHHIKIYPDLRNEKQVANYLNNSTTLYVFLVSNEGQQGKTICQYYHTHHRKNPRKTCYVKYSVFFRDCTTWKGSVIPKLILSWFPSFYYVHLCVNLQKTALSANTGTGLLPRHIGNCNRCTI